MIKTIITAIVSFASTNIDDIFILMLFFSQTNEVIKKRHIIIGQYLGICTLTIISIIGSLGVSLIPEKYIGLLGLVPIYLGVKAYIEYRKEITKDEYISQEELRYDVNTAEKTANVKKNQLITFINTSVLKVFSVTLANGGDNIGIYIPLFSSMSFFNISITFITYMFLVALWCFIGFKLAEYPFIQRSIEKYKHIFVPIVFIGLGVFILLKFAAFTA